MKEMIPIQFVALGENLFLKNKRKHYCPLKMDKVKN